MKKRGHFYPLRIKGVPEVRQGLIFYLCRCYVDLPQSKRGVLDRFYVDTGGEYAGAIRAVMETNISYAAICEGHNLSSATVLWRLRERFYREFPLYELLS